MSRLVSRTQRISFGLVCILRKLESSKTLCSVCHRHALHLAQRYLSAVRTLSALCTVAVDSQRSLL